MAFGAGVLISAVAYELVAEAFETSGERQPRARAHGRRPDVLFGDVLIDRIGGEGAEDAPDHGAGSGLAIVLGIVLDGIPGCDRARAPRWHGSKRRGDHGGLPFESPRVDRHDEPAGGRWTPSRIIGLWVLVTLVSGVASLLGYAVFDSAGPDALAFVLAFAGGAILTMLADTMMPEAFEHGGKLVGLLTTLGFGLAFALSMLE